LDRFYYTTNNPNESITNFPPKCKTVFAIADSIFRQERDFTRQGSGQLCGAVEHSKTYHCEKSKGWLGSSRVGHGDLSAAHPQRELQVQTHPWLDDRERQGLSVADPTTHLSEGESEGCDQVSSESRIGEVSNEH
jgi:hypothetical protein